MPTSIKGIVFSGPERGKHYIEYFHYRLRAVMKFEPFFGTLDLKTERPVDISSVAEAKELGHIGEQGIHHVEAHLMPVVLKCAGGECQAWAMQIEPIHDERSVYDKDVFEIVASECLRTKLGLKDDDEVEIIF
ncbi:MAG: DUF120 domain-containing protein [Candidatus Aenigmatarchaeota archaeon]